METELKIIKNNEIGKIWKKLLSIAIRVMVSAIVLSFVVSLVQWQNVLTAYRSADSRYIIFGGMLLLANLGVRTLKWRIMLHSVKESPTSWEAFGSVMLGISLGSFTPGEIGEYAGRALHINDAQRSHLVGLALLDKAQIFLVTSVAGIIGIVSLTFTSTLLISTLSIGLIVVLFIILLRMELLANVGHQINATFLKRSWLTRILEGFTLMKPKQIVITSLFTIAFHGVIVIQMFLLLCAFDRITFSQAFIGTSAMMFVKSLLPISLGDLGIREAGSIFFFSAFGISQAAALNASLLLFVINVFMPSVLGTFFLKYQKLSISSLLQFLKKKH
jgi:uncharacterized protein (TIRG00374 family)